MMSSGDVDLCQFLQKLASGKTSKILILLRSKISPSFLVAERYLIIFDGSTMRRSWFLGELLALVCGV